MLITNAVYQAEILEEEAAISFAKHVRYVVKFHDIGATADFVTCFQQEVC